jgi:hypothetical protein
MTDIKEIKLNDVVIKPIPKVKNDQKVKGMSLFDLYCNIFICAKKNSGKTTTTFKILKECCGKDTNVIVFCSTYMKDASWITIKEWLDDKEISNVFYHSIFEGKANILQDLITDLCQKADEPEKEEDDEADEDRVLMEEDEKHIKIKKRKPVYIAPEYIFIFDDLADELKSPVVSQLIKMHRHIKSKCIFSSQYVLDLPPMSRRNQDYYLLFGGINDEKLEMIYKYADLNITLEQFTRLYNYATSEKYKFLYVNTNKNQFRICFNIELKI